MQRRVSMSLAYLGVACFRRVGRNKRVFWIQSRRLFSHRRIVSNQGIKGSTQILSRRYPWHRMQHVRCKGFWAKFMESIREQTKDNQKLSESLDEIEKIKHSETLKKTESTVRSFVDKAKQKAQESKETIADPATKKMAGKLGKLKDNLSTQYQSMKEKTDLDKKMKRVSDVISKSTTKSKEIIDKATDRMVKISDSIQNSKAYKSAVKFTQLTQSKADNAIKQLPFVKQEEPKSDDPSAKDGKGKLVLKTDAIDERWQNLKTKIKSSGGYKAYSSAKTKIMESENPVISKTVDLGESVAYNTRRLARTVLKETDTGKTLRMVKAVDPEFSQEKLIKKIQSEMIPKIFKGLENEDIDGIKDYLSEHEYDLLKDEVNERKANGILLKSQALDLEDGDTLVELINASLIEERPTILVSFTIQQYIHMQDLNAGKTLEDDIKEVTYLWELQFRTDLNWEVTAMEMVHGSSTW
eukprot:TRINITY_DN6000_c0_g1_i1.p1 TRINITY_DN6000_c0_g1~~TRINITY_DN6000_c0_g1_i1.p1  ORF type:complete len:469 (+),score=77.54 TRINITY_DN6000_c0_g1_i1:100-1506(+)